MTARDIHSLELVEVARLLAPPKVGPGRPRTAHLRRAVSTAYYALFHELTAQAAAELCGEGTDGKPAQRQVSRWMGHSDVRTLANAASGTAGGGVVQVLASVLGSPHPDLDEIGRVFAALQYARQGADYDHDYDLIRSDVLSLIDRAEDAIKQARRLQQSGDPSYRRFLKLMVGAVKIARSRVG